MYQITGIEFTNCGITTGPTAGYIYCLIMCNNIFRILITEKVDLVS